MLVRAASRPSRAAPPTFSSPSEATAPAHPDVVVVAVDEKSAQRYGPLALAAGFLARRHRSAPRGRRGAVGLDMIFTDEVVDRRAQAYTEALDEARSGARRRRRRRAAALTAYREELSRAWPPSTRTRSSPRPSTASRRSSRASSSTPPKERAQFATQGRGVDAAARASSDPRLPGRACPAPLTARWTSPRCAAGAWTPRSFRCPLFVRGQQAPGATSTSPRTRTAPCAACRCSPCWSGPRGLAVSLELQTAAAYLDSEVEPMVDHAGEPAHPAPACAARTGSCCRCACPCRIDEPFMLINYPGPGQQLRHR